MKRKQNGLIADREVLVAWVDETSHDIPKNESPIHSKALTLSISTKAEKGEEAAKEKSEVRRGLFMRCKDRRVISITWKYKAKQQVLMEKLQQVIDAGDYTKQQSFSADQTALF